MSAQTIYLRLIRAGLSRAGACGLMGNMQCESAMRADNAQDGMTKLSDREYTALADSGKYAGFASDGIGYGLCQWTYPSRKAELLDFAERRGCSVGDEEMQVDFALLELSRDYPGLYAFLCSTNGVFEAARRVCLEYERPALANVAARAGCANDFFMRFADLEPEQDSADVPMGDGESEKESDFWPPRVLEMGMYGVDVVALQGLLIARGYPAGITGSFDAATAQKLMDFQRRHHLEPDGIAGPLSWAELVKGAAS